MTLVSFRRSTKEKNFKYNEYDLQRYCDTFETINISKEESSFKMKMIYTLKNRFSFQNIFSRDFDISFKSFRWGKNAIVSFLTPDEIKNLLAGTGNVEIVLSRENRLDVSKKWKYTLLMSDIVRLVVIGKVRRSG